MAVLWFLFLSSIWVNAVLPTQQFEDYSSHALGSSQSSGNSDAGTKLVLESWNWKTRRGFAIAEGEVTNISGSKLQNVMAVVSYYDASGEVITTDSTLTEFNPILPGQTSPFRVMTVRNPAMESTRLRFRHLMGGTISHRPCR
ncbi:MAG: FxLYD domain-containing protein [Phycisphaerae bacterium]